jgi:hypothetical protein
MLLLIGLPRPNADGDRCIPYYPTILPVGNRIWQNGWPQIRNRRDQVGSCLDPVKPD